MASKNGKFCIDVVEIANRNIPDEPDPFEHVPYAPKKKANADVDYSKRKKVQTKGQRNRRSREILASIEYVCHLLEDDIESDIKKLTPTRRVQLWVDLQEYLRPRLARIEQTGENGGPLNHRHTVVLKPHVSPQRPQHLPQSTSSAIPYVQAEQPDQLSGEGYNSNANQNLVSTNANLNINHHGQQTETEAETLLTHGVASIDGVNSHSVTSVSSLDAVTGVAIHNVASVRNVPEHLVSSDDIEEAEVEVFE